MFWQIRLSLNAELQNVEIQAVKKILPSTPFFCFVWKLQQQKIQSKEKRAFSCNTSTNIGAFIRTLSSLWVVSCMQEFWNIIDNNVMFTITL